MLALATKLEQGVTHGTFTRQDEFASICCRVGNCQRWLEEWSLLLADVDLVSVNVRVPGVASRLVPGQT